MKVKITLIMLILFMLTTQAYCNDKTLSKLTYLVDRPSQNNKLTSSPDDNTTKKIIKRTNLEREGWFFAEQGLYEEALVKYRAALDPSLINYEHEESTARGAIREIYKRQGKFDKALQIINEIIEKHPNEYALKERLEILALIKSREIKNNKPIYEYIDYVKAKYSKCFPPNGYLVGESGIYIDDLIHLYDYMHDYDSGIALMDEVIKYMIKDKWMNNLGGRKIIKEYTRVKEAWELNKKTGQHGHLQEVIRTSDVISW